MPRRGVVGSRHDPTTHQTRARSIQDDPDWFREERTWDGGPTPCLDYHPECEGWAGREPSECTENPTFMRDSCPRSCGACGGGSAADDGAASAGDGTSEAAEPSEEGRGEL